MKSQLINVEEMMELENHHLATIIVIDLGKKHWWMLQLMVKAWGVLEFYIISASSHQTLIKAGEIVILQWRKLADAILNEWSKLTSLAMGQILTCVSTEMMHWEYITFVVFLPNMYNRISGNHQIYPTWRTFYKRIELYSAKMSMARNSTPERTAADK